MISLATAWIIAYCGLSFVLTIQMCCFYPWYCRNFREACLNYGDYGGVFFVMAILIITVYYCARALVRHCLYGVATDAIPALVRGVRDNCP